MAQYVIITPARNEAEFIERTAESILSQRTRPARWVVVNDNSEDNTGAIAARYADTYSFIRAVDQRRQEQAGRNFARKVFAFNRGLAEVADLDFDFIGNIDADMSFDETYFETILEEMIAHPEIGISGGMVYSKFTKHFCSYDTTVDSVGGKVQLFRRRCFEDIGGYRALEYGGIDATAEIMARMKGWKVRKVPWARAYEHRPTGFAYGNAVLAKIKEGRRFYSLGYDPIFYLMRCLYRANEHPFVIGSGVAWLRYMYSMLRRDPYVLPEAVTRYLRTEQRAKLKEALMFRTMTGH